MRNAVHIWRRHRRGLDSLASAAVVIALGIWIYGFGGKGVVDDLLADNRQSVYGALASIWGALLGFAMAAVAIVIGAAAESERMQMVKQSEHYADLWTIFKSSIRALAAATLVAMMALILDRSSDPAYWAFIACFGVSLFAVLKVWWAIHVLELVIDLVALDAGRKINP